MMKELSSFEKKDGYKMKLVLITGMLGAGKTSALRYFEDLGFYCVDNLPPVFFGEFVKMCYSHESRLDKVAVVIDIRGGFMFDSLYHEIKLLKEGKKYEFEILFIDAKDEVILKRYKETRRQHILAKENGDLAKAIRTERKMLEDIRIAADFVVDTSDIKNHELGARIDHMFLERDKDRRILINFVSFGFKYGIAIDVDMLFDLRFLPNPFYIDELKEKTGLDAAVRKYVFSTPETVEFIEKLSGLLEFLLPYYEQNGRKQLVIGLACTGGKHRSVAISEELYHRCKDKYNVTICHRDKDRK